MISMAERNFRLLLLFGLQGGKSRVLEIFRRWANCWCWVPVQFREWGEGRGGCPCLREWAGWLCLVVGKRVHSGQNNRGEGIGFARKKKGPTSFCVPSPFGRGRCYVQADCSAEPGGQGKQST